MLGKRFAAELRSRFGTEPEQARAIRRAGFDSYFVSVKDGSGPRDAYHHFYWFRTGSHTALVMGMGDEAHRPALRRAAQSIEPLTARERARIKVNVVTSSTPRRGESLADFDRRTGNLWPPELTSAINSVAAEAPPTDRRLKHLARRSLR